MLLQGTPPGLEAGKVAETIGSVRGVGRVHNLNLWSLCSHIPVLTAHVEVSPSHVSRRAEVLEEIRATLRREHHIEHITLQPECGSDCTTSTIRTLRHERIGESESHAEGAASRGNLRRDSGFI